MLLLSLYMTQIRRFTEGTWREDPWFRALCQALLACENELEMADMLRDLATLSELQAMGERLEVARQLSLGKTYRKVSEETGASTTTVTRVAKYLENGEGGYRRYLKEVVPSDAKLKLRQTVETYTTYPLHTHAKEQD